MLRTDEAERAARKIEVGGTRGAVLGPLGHVPVAIKNVLTMKNSPLTFGTKVYERHVGTEDAPIAERLREAGAMSIGRTHVPEEWLACRPIVGTHSCYWTTGGKLLR